MSATTAFHETTHGVFQRIVAFFSLIKDVVIEALALQRKLQRHQSSDF